MAEHTPRPWEVGEGSKYAYVQIPESMSAMVRIPLDDKAIAYRISAAPEMMAALESWLEWDGAIREVPSPPMLARAAIAKAKGGA